MKKKGIIILTVIIIIIVIIATSISAYYYINNNANNNTNNPANNNNGGNVSDLPKKVTMSAIINITAVCDNPSGASNVSIVIKDSVNYTEYNTQLFTRKYISYGESIFSSYKATWYAEKDKPRKVIYCVIHVNSRNNTYLWEISNGGSYNHTLNVY